MGLQDVIAKFMTKLMGPMMPKERDWAAAMSDADIDELERQGCDVTELREKQARKALLAEEFAKKDAERIAVEIAKLDFSKLDAYKQTPRALDSDFLKDVAKHMGLKEKNIAELSGQPLIYSSIVQAHQALWDPNEERSTVVAYVYIFTLNPKYQYDIEWLNNVAKKISKLSEAHSVPADCKKMINDINNHKSSFMNRVPDSIADGVEVWCATQSIMDTDLLFESRIPANRIIPVLHPASEPKEGKSYWVNYIPSQYYAK